MRWHFKTAILLVALGSPMVSAFAETYDPKAVRIVEINGVRLYVPELWIWPDRPRPKIEQPSSIGVGFDSRMDASHVFQGPWLQLGFVTDSAGKGPNWKFYPELPPNLLPRWMSVEAGSHFEKQPLPYDATTPIPANHRMPDFSGGEFYLNCDSNKFGKQGFDECSVTRSILPSLQVFYRFSGSIIPQSEWLATDIRVQKIIEWLALPPSERPDIVDY